MKMYTLDRISCIVVNIIVPVLIATLAFVTMLYIDSVYSMFIATHWYILPIAIVVWTIATLARQTDKVIIDESHHMIVVTSLLTRNTTSYVYEKIVEERPDGVLGPKPTIYVKTTSGKFKKISGYFARETSGAS